MAGRFGPRLEDGPLHANHRLADGDRRDVVRRPRGAFQKSDGAADFRLQFLGSQSVKTRRTDVLAASRADGVGGVIEEQGPRLAGRVPKIKNGELRIERAGGYPLRPRLAGRIEPGDIVVGQLEATVGSDCFFFTEGEEKRRLAAGEVFVCLLNRADDPLLQLLAELLRNAETVGRSRAGSVVRVRGVNKDILRSNAGCFFDLGQRRVDLGAESIKRRRRRWRVYYPARARPPTFR